MDAQAAEEIRTDIVLLERIVARDERAVAELYDRHSHLLFSVILRILRHRSEAEEVLQEVFFSVWTKVESYNPALGSPAGWLVRIARNRGIDRLRTNAVRTRTLEAVEATRSADNPESAAARREEERRVRGALAALPADQRELIECAYFRGLTHSELANRFQLPLGTVKTRVRSGMQAMRQQLGSVAQHRDAV